MNSQRQLRRVRLLKSIATGSSVLCTVAGGLVLVGWGFDIGTLKSISPHWVAMKANTAVGFMLGGLSLWLVRDETVTSQRRWFGQACAAAVCLLGLLTLGEYAFHADLGIDQVLFKDSPSAVEPVLPGRMASATGLCFVLAGLGLLGLDWRTRRGLRPVQALPLLVAFVGLTDFTGYLYEAKSHYAAVPLATMALHSSVLFIVLSLGLLCARVDQGPLGILTIEGTGSLMARRLLPLTLAIPVLLGWLGMAGRQAGLYTLEFGIALLATSSAFVFSVVIWLTAVSLNRVADERTKADAAVHEAGLFAQSTIDALSAHVCVLDAAGMMLATNAAWQRFAEANPPVGASVQVGANYLSVCAAAHGLSAEGAAEFAAGIRSVMGGGRAMFAMEYPCDAPTERRWFEGRVTRFSGDGPVRVVVAHENITQRKQAEARLRGSEAQYRRLFEAAKDGILILNAETGMIEDVNPFLIELLGFTRAEVLQKKVWELGCFKHLIANQEKFAELQRVGYVRYEDLPLETGVGRKVDVEFVSNVYEVNGAKVVQCNIRNITERKRKEEELRWKTALLEAEVDATLDGILVVDPQGKKILQNQRMIDLWKLPPEIAADPDDARELDHVLGRTRNPEVFLAKVRHLYAHPDEVSEDEIELKDGTVLDRYSSPVRGKDGQHYGRIWAFRDITERKQAQQALRASEEKYKGLFEKTRDAIMTLGPPDWRFTSGNPAAVQLFGAKDEAEFVAHGPADTSPARQPDGASSAEKADRVIAKAMRDGSHFFEWTHRRLGGAEFLADVLLTRVVLGDGTKMLHATVRDITERKQAEQALHEKEHLLSESQRLGHVGSWFLDAAGAMAWSDEMYHIYGVSPATFTPSAEALLQLMHPGDRPAMQAWIAACAEGTKPGDLEFRITLLDGTVRYIMGRGEAAHDAAGHFLHMAGTAQDITRDKLAQAERTRLTRQMELLLESTDQGINGMDLAGRCTFINRAGAEMFRCTPTEALGQDMHAMVHHHKADGSPYPAAECPTLNVFRRDQSCHLDTEVFWRRDGTSFPVDYSSHPIREDGVITGAVVTFHDITEKKKLAAEFLRSQRMEGIGALAGGIAHDLNNALAPILMSAEILKLTITDPEKCRILDTIYDCARRGANMVKQILTFARGSEGERGVVQPRHLVQEMIDMTRHTFPKAIQIRTEIAPNIWTLLGNPTQLHQILLNLCVNARDAMPAGGTLTLAATNVTLDATGVELPPDARPGAYVVLTVKDTGTGMTPEVRARLFEAFFTTKAPGKGTGLGLTTVHNLAKEHGGFLTVDTEAGKGTTFKVYLPAQPDAVAAVAPTERPALPMGNGELILVVDDEAVIRSIAQQTLEAYGYRVVTAEDGAQAVGVCAQHLARLQLLITDMDMPVMDGRGSIRAIRSLLPGLRIIVASGSGSDALSASSALKALDAQAFLRKPYSADDLIRTVESVLHQAASA